MKKQNLIKYFALGCLVLVCVLTIYPQKAFRQDYVDMEIEADFKDDEVMGVFKNHQIEVPNAEIALNLGEASSRMVEQRVEKKIEVDLSQQKLYGYENGKKVYEFLISSGTWNRTPTGKFKIWAMIKSQKMSGGSRELGTYYYLPNVPNILFFYNDQVEKKIGYSIHGAYWHNQFGKPMSHGCINMGIEDSKVIFEWADMDTEIEIFGKMPIIQLPWAES